MSTAIALLAGLFGLIALLSAWFVLTHRHLRVLPIRSVAAIDASRTGVIRSGLAGGITSVRGETVYALDASGGWVVALRLSGEPMLRWHVGGDGVTELVRPSDIAAGPDGLVYVLDAGTGFVSKYDAWGRPQGRLLGPSAGVYEPKGLAVDDTGTVFVADTGTSRLLRVEPSGKVTVIGRDLPGRDGLREPVGIRCDGSGFLYVADSGNGRIKRLDANGRTVALWPLPDDPAYLALDGSGRIFATSPASGCVLALSLVDGVVAYVGAPAGEGTLFQRPIGVDFVGGRLYVSDGREIRAYEPGLR